MGRLAMHVQFGIKVADYYDCITKSVLCLGQTNFYGESPWHLEGGASFSFPMYYLT